MMSRLLTTQVSLTKKDLKRVAQTSALVRADVSMELVNAYKDGVERFVIKVLAQTVPPFMEIASRDSVNVLKDGKDKAVMKKLLATMSTTVQVLFMVFVKQQTSVNATLDILVLTAVLFPPVITSSTAPAMESALNLMFVSAIKVGLERIVQNTHVNTWITVLGVATVWIFTNVPATMAGLEQAALFLIVQMSISVQEKESVCPVTCAAVTQDSWGSIVVSCLTALILQTAVDTGFVLLQKR